MSFFSSIFLLLLLAVTPQVAERYEEKKDYLEAAKAWQALSREDPDNPFYYYKLGKNFYALREYDRAETNLKHALSMDPDNPDYLVMLAFIYLRQEKFDRSIALFEEVLKNYPNYTGARAGLEQAKKDLALQQISVKNEDEVMQTLIQLEAEERYEEILQVWQELVREHPDNYFYLFELARAYSHLEYYDEAIFYFKKSIALDPGNTDTTASLGYAYLHSGQYDLAEEAFHKALAFAPENTDALEGLRRLRSLSGSDEERTLIIKAQKFEEEGNYEDAVVVWERLVQIDPDDVSYLYSLGRALQHVGRNDQAEEYLTHAHTLAPDNVDVMVSLGYLRLRFGQNEEAEKLFAQVLKESPDYFDAQEGLEIAENRQKAAQLPDEEIAEAKEEPSKIVEFEKEPSHEEEIAEAEEKPPEIVELEKEPSYEEEIAEAEEKLPDPFEQALTFEKSKEYEKALEIWKALAEEEPSNPYYFYKMGKLYIEMDKIKLAQRALAKARMLDPTNSDVAVALGFVYLKQGRESRAKRLFTEVLIASPDYTDARDGLRILRKREEARQEPERFKKQQLYEEAIALDKNGKQGQAAEKWRKLLELEPDNFFFLYKLGRYYNSIGKTEEAESFYRRSLKEAPDNVDTKVVLGYLLVAQKEYEEAKQLFEEVLAAIPTYEDAQRGLDRIADIYAYEEEQKKPKRFTKEQLEQMDVALCYEEKHDYDNAAIFWEELHEQDPDEAYFSLRLGRIYSLQRKYQKANPLLEEAAWSEKEMNQATARLAANYAAMGQHCEAHRLYQILVDENPENVDYLEALGRSHRSLNQYSEALEVYTQRFTLGNPHYHLFKQKQQVTEWTEPSASGTMLYVQERETDILTRLLSAQRNTTLGGGKYNLPICDKLRLTGSVEGSTIREMNLIARNNNLFVKQQDYALGFVWLMHPSFTFATNFDYQVGRDIGVPRFPIGHRYRILPSLIFNYSKPDHLAQFTMEYDTLLIKDFLSVPTKGNLLKRLTLLFQDEQLWFYRNMKVGVETFYRYYEGDPFNRQWQAAIYSQVGFPKYSPCFFLRYWGQAGGFTTNQTVYYSYKRQWQHTGFIYFSKQAPLNMQIDVALEQTWQWNRQLNQPVNTLIFINKLYRNINRLYFEVKHLYRPHTEFHIKTTSYWDSTRYTSFDVKGSVAHVF